MDFCDFVGGKSRAARRRSLKKLKATFQHFGVSLAIFQHGTVCWGSKTGWSLVGNEGINLYIGILGIHSLIPY